MTFVFGTKAETLARLGPLLKKSVIPKFTYFPSLEWKRDSEALLRKVQLDFASRVVVRSSALSEDSESESMAGKFHSVLDIDPKNRGEVANAIGDVILSYANAGVHTERDQVIIQQQVTEAIISGVIFTRDIETGAPYYVISYDDYSGRTDIITSGVGTNNKIFTFNKFCKIKPTDAYLSLAIDCIREIEEVTGRDDLDIEFVIKDDVFYTLQVRPLAALKDKDGFDNEAFISTLENVKKFIAENNVPVHNVSGKSVAYGIMPDWNPAEIVGVDPKPLAFSLYRYLITDEIWPLSRQQVGYKNVGYQPGICSLGGKPYVDVRMSFNTFTPQDLDEEVTEKLIDFYLMKLRRFQDFHDKVEFNVVYTCYRLDFENVEEELLENGFFADEIDKIKTTLFRLTDEIVSERITSIDRELKLTAELKTRRNKLVKSQAALPAKIAQLGYDCRNYGTLPFSKLARFAFIGSTFMRSLRTKGIITKDEYDELFASIRTVATDFLDALEDLKNEHITREEFLEDYGHLRPGTYDICSKTYRENFDSYVDLKNFKAPKKTNKKFELKPETKQKIEEELRRHGFKFSADHLLTFIKKAISARERCKFDFTKNLSLMLEYTELFFRQHGISREDVAFLTIQDVFEISHSSMLHDAIKSYKEKIAKRKEYYAMMKSIRLPPLIFLERNVEYFRSIDNMPNYITQKSVLADVVDLSAEHKDMNLKGKIVLIENADPGYDWIFSHDIAGLITEFGGAASHMAIRAAEFMLPAAIGCGATMFGLLKGSKKVELNCGSKQIKIIC